MFYKSQTIGIIVVELCLKALVYILFFKNAEREEIDVMPFYLLGLLWREADNMNEGLQDCQKTVTVYIVTQ